MQITWQIWLRNSHGGKTGSISSTTTQMSMLSGILSSGRRSKVIYITSWNPYALQRSSQFGHPNSVWKTELNTLIKNVWPCIVLRLALLVSILSWSSKPSLSNTYLLAWQGRNISPFSSRFMLKNLSSRRWGVSHIPQQSPQYSHSQYSSSDITCFNVVNV